MPHRRILLSALLLAAITGCATAPTPVSVPATIAARPDLSTLNRLVAQAGLTETLQGPGPFTVFAPSDEAFKALPAKTMDDLSQHPDRLKDVLTYHVLATRLMSADARNSNVKTVNGANAALSKAGDFITVEDALATTADIVATNGVVHVVDKVLLPPVRR